MKSSLKTLAVWLIIGIIFIVLVTSILGNSDNKLSYSELLTKVEAGEVKELKINSSGTSADVKLKNENIVKEVNIPSIDSLMDTLQEPMKTGSIEVKEDSESSTPNETDETEAKDPEVDYKPLLEALSKKVKYNGESVNIDNIEDLITNYQKGLNYDKKQEQYENLQNSKVEQYVSKKAKELGMSVDEYIEQVENYEKEQEREKEQARLEEMINNGVPEDVAKEVIATSQLRKQLQEKENALKEQEEKAKAENDKNKQYADFVEQFPNVEPESIPKEVFEKAQETNLVSAYKDWLIKDLETKLQIKEQNEKNASRAIGSVTDTGTTQKQGPIDPFLEGFNSD